MMRDETPRLREAVQSIAGHGLEPPDVALVLGSGLKGFGESLEGSQEIPFGHIPSWPRPRVEGHGGSLIVGSKAGVPVACLTGRVHLYEGWGPNEVVRAVRTLRLWGVSRFLLTNAAGGLAAAMKAGDLMVIDDHINLTGRSALVGDHEQDLGDRFPDQSEVYDRRLRDVLLACDPNLRRGVYAGLLGPSYETPAEVRMLQHFGASAVGMSTVLEATALNAMGAQVCGVSLISNLAAGLGDKPLSHEEVIEVGRQAEGRLAGLLERFLKQLPS